MGPPVHRWWATAGIRPGDLVGAITNEAGVPGSAVGAIQINDAFSLVDVQAASADDIGRALAACDHPRPASPGPPRPLGPDAILTGMGAQAEPVPEVVRYGSGTLKMTGFRLDGALHGAWSWYRLDGSLMRAGSFDRGRQIGVWATYDRAGRVVKETDFGS